MTALLPLGGCLWPVRESTDRTVRRIAAQPWDVVPESALQAAKPSTRPTALGAVPRPGAMRRGPSGRLPSSTTAPKGPPAPEPVPTDVQTVSWLEPADAAEQGDVRFQDDGTQTASFPARQVPSNGRGGPQLDLNIPSQVPGSEAPRIELPRLKPDLGAEIERIYPELPPLPEEPVPLPGPEGKPYTLSDLQRIAAGNSPTLRQAVADVEQARGALVQARTYPNPTAGYLVDPTNNNSTSGVQGGFIDQPIRTGGKQKLGVAAAQRDLENAEFALRRARTDLATAVRNAYFTLLVDVETLVITRALSRFSDDIYRLQKGLLLGTQAAPYEPTALRAQAFNNRLAYKQAIASYIFDWKALVATLGLQQLPLTQVAGQVDRLIPYFDYDKVRAYVLENHTDILTARNSLTKARYMLKLAQVTPWVPDIEVRAQLEKDYTLAPFGTYQTLVIGMPIPLWDKNKGNIIAAQGLLVRATEESHRVEVALTNGLAAAYANYQNNLYAMEYYRRDILPDLVRYYRGVYARRQIDPASSFGDLVFAQQNLSTNAMAYLNVLQSLWTSVVSVADYLQTNDMFQLARPRELPELPDFRQLPCGHPGLAEGWGKSAAGSGGKPAAGHSTNLGLPAPGKRTAQAPRATRAAPAAMRGDVARPVSSRRRAAGPGPAATATDQDSRHTSQRGL